MLIIKYVLKLNCWKKYRDFFINTFLKRFILIDRMSRNIFYKKLFKNFKWTQFFSKQKMSFTPNEISSEKAAPTFLIGFIKTRMGLAQETDPVRKTHIQIYQWCYQVFGFRTESNSKLEIRTGKKSRNSNRILINSTRLKKWSTVCSVFKTNWFCEHVLQCTALRQ